MLSNDRVVGYLVSGCCVLCADCYAPSETKRMVVLCHENVYPYNQDCAKCHTCLVLGDPSYPILFEGVVCV